VTREYADFLERKTQLGGEFGFDPVWMPDFLFGFQVALVEWACRKGRGAIFADCGLGKTPMQLVWAENVVRQTGKPVLIITPLAVSYQTIREGEKFGIEVKRSSDGAVPAKITVTNYERLQHFNWQDFAGAVCDESSAIKAFDGKRREIVTKFLRKIPYRLLCTATAAPNDYIELGTSSEALGYLDRTDMMGRFFKNDERTSIQAHAKWTGQNGGKQIGWRLKGHAEDHFWRWVCSWARAVRTPSDLGFDDGKFILPELRETEHLIQPQSIRSGWLFDIPATGLWEEREEARRTITERCERVADLVNGTGQPAIVWCHLNDEGDLLEKLIPGSVQVAGRNSDDEKEERLISFVTGASRVLVIKPRIGAYGLNMQHCAHMTFFPSHSYEQYYQGVRRCWRFGQTRPVQVDIVTTPGGQAVMENLKRKSEQADKMFTVLVSHMNEALSLARRSYYTNKEEVPAWLSENR